MHKVLLISGLALTLAGCAASQEAPSPVQVQDLSSSRSAERPASYTVEAGDTLYGIAWRHDMDYRDLARLNRIEPPYNIQPGQQLTLGGGAGSGSDGRGGDAGSAVSAGAAGGAVATGLGGASQDDGSLDWLLPDGGSERSGDEAQAEAASDGGQASDGEGAQGPGPVYDPESPGADGTLSESDQAERRSREEREQAGTEGEAAAQTASDAGSGQAAESESDAQPQADAGTRVAGEPEAESRESRSYTPVDDVPWQWPASGDVIGTFGEGGTITAGIDIDGQKGQPVKAAGPGIVVYAGSGVRGYGNLILLKHNDEFLSAYAHNDSLRVKENDVVETGEVIATMGDSDAEDVRLHFEVRKDGQPQDPLEYLPKR